MKTNEFIQTINATSYISRFIKISDVVLQINELRKLHVRLQTKLEYLLLDPFQYENKSEREKIKSIAIEIKQFANENDIQINFNKLPVDYLTFSKQYRDEKKFASYWYKNIEITNLIVFTQIKKQIKSNKKIETLKQANLELENDIEIFDDNNININKINGYDYL